MGVDIYAKKAFTLSLQDFLELIKPAHVKGIRQSATQLFLKQHEGEELNDLVQEALVKILDSETPEDMVNALDNIFSDSSEEDDGDNDNSQEFLLIKSVSRVILPIAPYYYHIFTSSRTEDWNGPYNEPILIFDYDRCFKEVMTPMGKTIAKTIGVKKIRSSSWTEYSV